MSNFTAKLFGPLAVYDVNSNLITSVTLTNIATPITDYSQGSISFSATAVALSLPVAQTNFIFLQNTGANPVSISWTPEGGTGANVQNLGVSSVMAVCQIGTTSATGVSNMTASCAGVGTVSYFLGG